MGYIVETVTLDYGCKSCGEVWKNHTEMIEDKNIKSDLDYDQMVYFHNCDVNEIEMDENL